MQVLQKYVVSLGVNLRMMVELNSNSNVTIEIISKTKTKEVTINKPMSSLDC